MEETIQAAFAGSSTGVLTAGFLIGLWHAREADHLAAVSTIVTERKSLWSSAIVGGIWGVGHTVSLLAAGLVLIFLKTSFTEQTARILEFCVGIMLVLLGLNVLRKLWQGKQIHSHTHTRDGSAHSHTHEHAAGAEPHSHRSVFNTRALVVGLIHGLAGSAALMLLVSQSIESPATAILYIVIFGVGSIFGMMLMSLLIGLPLHFTASRFAAVNLTLQFVAGLFSVGWGLFIIYEKAFVEGLAG